MITTLAPDFTDNVLQNTDNGTDFAIAKDSVENIVTPSASTSVSQITQSEQRLPGDQY